MYSGRTPETHYFKHGFITFRKKHGGFIGYNIWKYDESGLHCSLILSLEVKDEADLKRLLAIQDLGSVT